MGKLGGRGLGSRIGKAPSRLRRSMPQDVPGPSARRSVNWLNSTRWRKLRLRVLVRDEYICQQTGVALIGKYPTGNSPVVDHKVPHRGDPDLFWDENNLQAVAKDWHDSVKQGIEKRGEI